MASMEYCVLENTAIDFAECISKLERLSDNGEVLSDLDDTEQRGAKKLYDMLQTYKRLYERLDY